MVDNAGIPRLGTAAWDFEDKNLQTEDEYCKTESYIYPFWVCFIADKKTLQNELLLKLK